MLRYTVMEGRMFHTTVSKIPLNNLKNLSSLTHIYNNNIQDGGSTWEKVIIDGVIPLGLDCADADNCVATAVTNTRQATVALYN